MPFFFDFTYLIFMAPVLLLSLYAQWKVKSTYSKYAQVRNGHNITGAQVAQMLMRNEGLTHVGTELTPGELTDHYDPRGKIMRLSQGSAQVPSVAAMAIVAHELGHAQQDKERYFWLNLRAGIVGIANIGSSLGLILIMVGLGLMSFASQGGGLGTIVAWIGVALMSGAVIFSFVTLPVEFDASNRAKAMLERNGLVTPDEARGVKAVLDAAALTYVAAAATALVQLLYYVMLIAGRRRE